jgi:hypothetical protein
MNAHELIKRIADLEERASAAEARIQTLEHVAGRAEQVAQQDNRIQSIEEWRESFSKPPRSTLTIRGKHGNADA